MSLLQVKLVDRIDIAQYLQISKSVNEDKLNEMIIKVQINELMPLLGVKLFNDILTTPANYTALLNGGSYVVGMETFINYGLKSVLVHYVDAYYKMFGDVTDTPFGLVNKLNGNESKPIDNNFKKSLYVENQKVAFNLWLNVREYLIRTENIFFKNINCSNQNKSFNFTKII